jgi:hypothetical protein
LKAHGLKLNKKNLLLKSDEESDDNNSDATKKEKPKFLDKLEDLNDKIASFK